MNLRQKSSRYCNSVMFLVGINGVILLFTIIRAGLRPGMETWLASALVITLILHARAGFALSRAEQELDLLSRQTGKIMDPRKKKKKSAAATTASSDSEKTRDDHTLNKVKIAIENAHIDLYLQPIVSLPLREAQFYEAFSRLRKANGAILRPDEYLEAAERANKIGVIDNMILLRAVQALRELNTIDDDSCIFCNVSPATIYDDEFFVRFTDYLDANDDLASRLVFEFTYPAVEIMHARVIRNLEAIAERGYAFSVDHITQMDHDWRALRQKNFRYVKAPCSMMVRAANGPQELKTQAQHMINKLDDLGISLIVEKVEQEAQMQQLLTLGAQYGQGMLFGAPFHVENKASVKKPYAKAS